MFSESRTNVANTYSQYQLGKLESFDIPKSHWIYNLMEYGVLPLRKDVIKDEWAMYTWNLRDLYVQTYSFCLITMEVYNELVEYFRGKKVLEVAGGSGYMASLLQRKGIDVKVTDSNKWANGNLFGGWKHTFTEVEEMDALEAIDAYADNVDTVILSWPVYNDPLGHDVLQKCLDKGLTLIYIGETIGGCTADDSFFDLMEDKCVIRNIIHSYRPFTGIHDFVYELRKKGN